MYQYNSVYSKELPSPPKPNPGGNFSSLSLTKIIVNLDQELKLYSNSSERELYDNLADLYAIIISLEHLEKAYIRDCVPATA
jgi:ESCRT-I complex subunit VPS28